MVTAKPIVIPSNKRRDGSYLVFVRVYFNGKVRRIPTSVVCRPGDLTRGLRIKSQSVLEAAGLVVRQMMGAVEGLTDAQLEGKDVDWVVARMKSADVLHNFRLDFFQFADKVIQSKSEGGRCQYVTACHTFAEFLGRREIDINDITKPLLSDFLQWMDGKAFSFQFGRVSPSKRVRIPMGAESRNMAKLAHIFNKAKEMYNDEDGGTILIPRSPFTGMIPKHPRSRAKKPLSVELVQRMIDARHRLPTVQTALDVAVLSFALCGVNLADLYEAADIGDVWEYNRRKTRDRRMDGAEMRVRVPECVKNRLPSLVSLHRMAGRDKYATAKVNKGLKRWCEDEGIPVFTFGAIRHSWATIARYKAGVEKATVDECLCHIGDYRVTDIYLERDWELLDDANRKVLELFKW
jgi:integrase